MILRKQNSAVKGSRKQIAVVCTTGRGTAAMIIQQLRRVLGNDVDITQYSEEDFNVDLNQDYFAIFTTVPLKYKDSKSPVIQVNHLLMINGCRKNGRGPMLFIKKSRNSQLTFSSVESPKNLSAILAKYGCRVRETSDD